MRPELAQKLLSDESLMKGVLAVILSIAKSLVKDNQEVSEILSKITVDETLPKFKLYLQNIVILHVVSGMIVGGPSDAPIDFTKGGIMPEIYRADRASNPSRVPATETIINTSQQCKLLDFINKK